MVDNSLPQSCRFVNSFFAAAVLICFASAATALNSDEADRMKQNRIIAPC